MLQNGTAVLRFLLCRTEVNFHFMGQVLLKRVVGVLSTGGQAMEMSGNLNATVILLYLIVLDLAYEISVNGHSAK